jgi:hypothetical protein
VSLTLREIYRFLGSNGTIVRNGFVKTWTKNIFEYFMAFFWYLCRVTEEKHETSVNIAILLNYNWSYFFNIIPVSKVSFAKNGTKKKTQPNAVELK